MEQAKARETLLFGWLLAFAILFWILIIVGTVGIGLLYVLGFFVFYLFTHSALISSLKGNSVRITSVQFPDLHAKISAACEKIKMPMPDAYISNGNGVLNAFATKFLGRNYIVLLSDVIDAFDENSDAITFYIGHELGHIHRKHIRWWSVLLPAAMFPLLWPAYRRACELTCDQYGRLCCASTADAVHGVQLLAAGKTRWKSMSADSYMGQIDASGGFWMSFHEITASYPWLTKRLAKVQDPAGSEAKWPQRHPMAWFLGMITPGWLPGALVPLVLIYFVFIVGVIAYPIMKKAKQAASSAPAVTAPSNVN
ncbi:MAG: M48 family metalloprotease [Bdellovibrionales bacterium]